MIEEAVARGLSVDRRTVNHLAWGKPREGSPFKYVEPDFDKDPHNSMSPFGGPLNGFRKAIGTGNGSTEHRCWATTSPTRAASYPRQLIHPCIGAVANVRLPAHAAGRQSAIRSSRLIGASLRISTPRKVGQPSPTKTWKKLVAGMFRVTNVLRTILSASTATPPTRG